MAEQLGQTYSRNQSLTINAAAQTIVSYPQKRKAFYLRNVSTGGQVITITLSDTLPAVAGTGIILNVNDSYVEATDSGFIAWDGHIKAIASAIGGTLAVMER